MSPVGPEDIAESPAFAGDDTGGCDGHRRVIRLPVSEGTDVARRGKRDVGPLTRPPEQNAPAGPACRHAGAPY